MDRSWLGHYMGEAAGVFLIVLFGDAVVFAAVLMGAGPDLMTIGLGWGVAVGLAVWANATISGAHFNPGVTLVMAWRRNFPWKHVLPYMIFQTFGGLVAAALLQLVYSGMINHKLASLGLLKGAPGSQLVGMIFAPVTPNPGLVGIGPASLATKLHVADGWSQIALWQGFVGEFFATALLVIFILVLLEQRNTFGPVGWFFPAALGLAVMMLVVFEAGPSMVSLNAARDFGPRLFMWFMGWGKIAFPGPRGDWWVTTIGPTLGALAGGGFYDFVMLRWFPRGAQETPAGRRPETDEGADLPRPAL
ncbi:MAG: hypothetical protein HKL89_01115 [Candidatus Dormibacteraeota bacterium]|nr:hypothetical protein [Candidatus Dormibacteraeota bacterium]